MVGEVSNGVLVACHRVTINNIHAYTCNAIITYDTKTDWNPLITSKETHTNRKT